MGGNQKDSKLRIAAEYQKNKPDNTEFLIREYKRGGRGLTIDGQPFSMWFDTDGITIGSGRRAVGVNGGDFYTWSEVDKRIRALLDEGSYLPQTELNKAWNFVRHELAERIWCFYRDNHDIGMPAKWKMGKEKRVLNNKETTIARQKQESIKQAFRDWIFSDPERRYDLVKLYNKRFNSTRPREYDGSHIMFSDMSPEIKLEKHQVDAIARVLYGGNTLLAHEVGAGKTFEMTAAAMESKRLGLCRKSMIAVPNHLTEQWASEFMRLYPAASILVTKKKDFEPANRKKFCARIATGDYDAVIIGHSQFEKIPLSAERQERYLRDKISEIKQALRESDNAERYTVKELEKMLKSYKAKLERLAEGKTRDDIVTFEELGVDRLFVDEAHNFKDL
ncbi:hypothetical protein FACS189425_02860 [Clostridia bacterium]|nr:hypothetical protein FACS189425_02860 [Clostridia bacterium]